MFAAIETRFGGSAEQSMKQGRFIQNQESTRRQGNKEDTPRQWQAQHDKGFVNYYCQAHVNAVKRTWAPKLQQFSNSYHLRHYLRGGISQEVETPRYLSLVAPLTKVGDEAVHKELGDRMERATTTTSSLEAEQDSGEEYDNMDAELKFRCTWEKHNYDEADNCRLRTPIKGRENWTDEEKCKTVYGTMKKKKNPIAALRSTTMGSDVKKNKEKKEEGREETTKGGRKKMLRRKRAEKESSKKLKVEEEKESEEVE
ncbi:hypothetical protein Tco_0538279 [Tanacetum coccineum]